MGTKLARDQIAMRRSWKDYCFMEEKEWKQWRTKVLVVKVLFIPNRKSTHFAWIWPRKILGLLLNRNLLNRLDPLQN